jgi:hypothetical protein
VITIGARYRGHVIVACVPMAKDDGYAVLAERLDEPRTSYAVFTVDASMTIFTAPRLDLPDMTYALRFMLDRAGHRPGGLMRVEVPQARGHWRPDRRDLEDWH